MRRVMRIFGIVAMACWFLAVTGLAQSADWHGIFRDLISTDPKISGDARSLVFKTLIPTLHAEDPKALEKDLAKVIEEFQQENESIRLQASGLLAGLARARPDGTESMKLAVPVWLVQFNDTNPRVRANAIGAIANLQPRVPAEAVPALLRLIEGNDSEVKSAAILGLVRSSGSSVDAVQGLTELMAPEKPIETRRTVIRVMAYAGVSDPVLIAKLGETLGDEKLVREALRTIAALGRGALSLRPLVVNLAADDRDKDISNAAAAVLKRLEQ